MSPSDFAEWLTRQKYKIFQTKSSYWVKISRGIFQAFPYHWIIRPSESEIKEFLLQKHGISLRYSTPMDAKEGMVSYHVVLNNNSYSLQTLSANARSKVHRGLKRCKIELISFDQLAQDGWTLQQDTLQRQGRSKSMNCLEWRRLCFAAKGLPDFEAWGAFVDDNLAASILTAQVEDVCYMLYPQSHRKYFGEYVNNALIFEITQEMLLRRGLKEVFYGVHSLDAPLSVDEFKFHMGYTAKPVRQRVVINPWVRPFFNSVNHAVLQAGLYLCPNNPFLSKAEGMLRFYLQGRLPLSKQSLPIPFTGPGVFGKNL